MGIEEPVKESSQTSNENDTISTDLSIAGSSQCESNVDQLELSGIESEAPEHEEIENESPEQEAPEIEAPEHEAPEHEAVEHEALEHDAVQHEKVIDDSLQDSEVKETPIINHEMTGDHEGDDSDVGSVSSGASQEVPIEREEGDGQESEKKDKKLDRDEDKRDPQYIPKKGNFYEHDDRTSEGEEPSNGSKKHLTPKAFESKERWGHDLYDDGLQSPKSREELIEQYGYDIRLEEGPPKARRRRRYGRGPNKYTRRWEEEEAYAKSRGSWRGRGLGRPSRNSVEDFPPLPEKDAVMKAAVEENKSENKPDSVKKEPVKMSDNKHDRKDTEKSVTHSVRRVKIDEASVHNASPSRGRGPARGRGRVSQPFKSGNFQRQSSTAEEDIATLSKHFAEAVINVDNKSIPSKRASSVPPSNSSDSNGTKNHQASEDTVVDKSGVESKSKRYSMQRQRSLPQATTNGVSIVQQTPQPPPPPPQHYVQPPEQPFFHPG
nr:protein CASC3-like isoform X2 [Halyomorpha halys]